ncbi:electron transfer flavoprotein subunit beta/FixA family protein [Clostridium estertheticum]|uniref:electron transfer flavoprotein subunit beta/FixA family protein n=1 Tax=Clostridium estertheticum TaxID=238834 RepID=UPI0013EEB3D7|nr:electron transfer flavoprotein subunit beta/FixA family protein [Clostridium estertheticum]MBZ9609072.1 electron transfer flavoprotein subunit beta/FixA family protein [Clostridium estertheticum]
MNIVVCIKQVQEYNNVNVYMDDKEKQVINPVDIFALEEALRIKDTMESKVTVVSMGIESVENTLRECIALGADEGVLFTDNTFAGSDTLATSYLLSRGIAEIGKQDLIICGTHSIDGDTAQVGPALAEKLGVSHTTHVIQILNIGENNIICKRMVEDGYEIIELKLPALITVVKGINSPRIRTIKGVLKSTRSEIKKYSSRDLNIDINLCGLKGSPTKVKGVYTVIHENKGKIIEGNSINEKLDYLVQCLF